MGTIDKICVESSENLKLKILFVGWDRFHKSWVQGANHRDSSIHFRYMPMPNFLEAFYWRKSLAQGAKDWGRAQNSL